MKPKDIAEALIPFKEYIHHNVLIISLLAGVSTHSIKNLLQKDVPIIRAMPNTSAAILKSATAISPSKHATKEHIQTAIALFETIGLVSVVEEEDMHAATALSGSGPAYIYYVVEAMEEAAKEIGLKEDVAKSLILQTMIGAAEMLKASENILLFCERKLLLLVERPKQALKYYKNINFNKHLFLVLHRQRNDRITSGKH